MFWRNIRSNLIKWWRIVYVPVARKIFHTRQEQEAYEAEQKKKEEITDEPPSETTEKKEEIDPDLLHNKNYNATTGAMSGEYGTHAMDDNTKEQLNSILHNNYSTTNIVDSLIAKQSESKEPQEEKVPDTSALDEEEAAAKAEQIKKANEIYERLLQEAKADELKRQEEIAAAMQSSQN